MKPGDILYQSDSCEQLQFCQNDGLTACRLYDDEQLNTKFSSYLRLNEFIIVISINKINKNYSIIKVLHSSGIKWVYESDVKVIL